MVYKGELRSRLQTAPEVWRRIFESRTGVLAVGAFALYPNRPHGVSVRNLEDVCDMSRLMTRIEHSNFPTHKTTEHLAVSCTFGLDHNQQLDYYDGPIKINNPMQMISLDFESENSHDNQRQIIKSLYHYQPDVDWFLLDSGQSFHLIVNTLIAAQNLPWHYGRIIELFLGSARENNRHIFKGISQDLMKDWKNPGSLIRLSEDILSSIRHRDESPTKGESFFIDLRHMARTLIEVLAGEPSGFLRCSPKYGSAPVLVAERIKREVTYYMSPNYPFGSPQIKLPI